MFIAITAVGHVCVPLPHNVVRVMRAGAPHVQVRAAVQETPRFRFRRSPWAGWGCPLNVLGLLLHHPGDRQIGNPAIGGMRSSGVREHDMCSGDCQQRYVGGPAAQERKRER